jgi:hypothetical protein
MTLPVGERCNRRRRESREFQPLQGFGDAAVRVLLFRGAARGEPEVFAHAQAIHHRRHLRLDAHALPRDGEGRPAGDILALDEDAAGAWAKLPRDAFEEGALAGAVGADEAAQFARRK